MNLSGQIPAAHLAFLERAMPVLRTDERIVGVAAAGSLPRGLMDAFSDIDLILAVEPASVARIMEERKKIAARLGPLVAAFTGEHVNEPRLLICLYAGVDGAAPLHVDLKFVALPDVAKRVDEPVVLWEREGRVTEALKAGVAVYPMPKLQWIEDRFWVWVHYATLKIGRGELFDTVDFLAWLRDTVLGPLSLQEAGAQPSGVRRIETAAPARAAKMQGTVAAYDRGSCVAALRVAVGMYKELRAALRDEMFVANDAAERVAMGYLDDVARGG